LGSATDAVVVCEIGEGVVSDDSDCNDADDTILGPTLYYVDSDGDGYGSDAMTTEGCETPSGYADNADDCDDADDSTGAATTWYTDSDLDGYGSGTPEWACTAPSEMIEDGTDCNDSSAAIFPGATEYCGDGLDFDCDEDPDDWESGCIDLEPLDVLPMYSCTGEPSTFTVTGEHIRVAYGEDGFWHNDADEGFAILPPYASDEAEWSEVIAPGVPIDQMTLEVTGDGRFFSGGHGSSTSDFTLTCANQIAMGDVRGAIHRFRANWIVPTSGGRDISKSVYITRKEVWNFSGNTMLVQFEVSAPTATGDFTLQRFIDPDISGETSTEFTRTGGTYTSATSPSTGWTVGWGTCDSVARIGAVENRAEADEDTTMCESDGITADMMLGYRWSGTLPGSGTFTKSFVMSVGRSEGSAYSAWDDDVDDFCGDSLDHSSSAYWSETCSPMIIGHDFIDEPIFGF